MFQLPPRKKRILQAVVEKYVATVEPVGSHTIVRELDLGVSSATVRNDLAELEEMDLLTHPHISAGRMPTDLGYRVYVDELLSGSPAATSTPQPFQTVALDVEQMLEIACRTLAQWTSYPAVLLVPTRERHAMKHVQLGNVNSHRVLVVVMTSTGEVEHRLFEVPSYVAPSRLQRIARFLNEKLKGRALSDIKALCYSDIADPMEPVDAFAEKAFEFVKEIVMAQADDKVLVEGVVYILNEPEFSRADKAREWLNALEERQLLTRLLSAPLSQMSVTVIIGREHGMASMQETSFVGAPYRVGEQWFGSVGILGPTRMRYSKVMPDVQSLAQQLGKCLSDMV